MRPLHVLVVGANGFIGRHVVARLLADGHHVTCAGRNTTVLRRRFPNCRVVGVELRTDDAAIWALRLDGIDAVVNAAGILRGDLDGVQRRGPMALLDACAASCVRRVVQVSALGAGLVDTPFLRSKAAADIHLLRLARDGNRSWSVVRPSLVIGRGGASTALFSALAAFPRPLRLGPGTWQVQPVHVSDVARAIADLVATPAAPETLNLVGPEPMSTDGITACLRSWLGLPPRHPLAISATLLRFGARLGDALPDAALTRDTLRMLEAGNVADPAPAAAALGWAPRPLNTGLAAEPACAADLLAARMVPVRGVLLACLAAVWAGTGVASLLVPPARADALLSGLGLLGGVALAATRAGALLDLALGLGLLPRRHRRFVLAGQLALMAAYTVLASVALPLLWLDPFGPLLKNLAVLAATLALLATEA
jgi:uncharacterized protein YbjT (DUF2867 family)